MKFEKILVLGSGALKIGEATDISVKRWDKIVDLKITPGSRE